MMRQEELNLREKVGKCVLEALLKVCGGSFLDEDERKQLRESALASISFPNKQPTSAGGKPHDIEVRIVLSLFHRWKRAASGNPIHVISDFGLSREICSPRNLGELLCIPLEEVCRDQGIAHNIGVQPSGVICIVTYKRSDLLRQAGKLPCPHCVQWFKGEKGLWWHQQQNHRVEHSEAAAVAAASTDSLAIIPYDPNPLVHAIQSDEKKPAQIIIPRNMDDPLEYIKEGNLKALRDSVQNGYDPVTEIDRRGASPLMWAAGSGHLNIVRFLIADCGCDPSQPQRGKRSFSGRTALHWAARNGQLPVVQYLVCECNADVEAATIDGTTAFGWACWQGHMSIMGLLVDRGCDIHCTNSFGCNAVLWCAQGKGDVCTMQWLESSSCNLKLVNHNGHGVVHKAAQRSQRNICQWFFDNHVHTSDATTALKLVGPDTEGYCPSDLAGMEGYEDLARWLALNEMNLIDSLQLTSSPHSSASLPKWLYDTKSGVSMRISEKEQYTWEKFGGIRRMRSRLTEKATATIGT